MGATLTILLELEFDVEILHRVEQCGLITSGIFDHNTHTCTYTGQHGWGYAWYINGSLIPELVVERGKEYKFITEGGVPSNDTLHYPLYITSSKNGGRLRNDDAQKAVCIKFPSHFTIIV